MSSLSSMDSDIRLEVVHVDSEGRNRGGAPKDVAHSMPGLLHLAFSIFLFDEHDRLVLQRRASKKKALAPFLEQFLLFPSVSR